MAVDSRYHHMFRMDIKVIALVTIDVVLLILREHFTASEGTYDWLKRDNFDKIVDKYLDPVNAKNCKRRSKIALMMPDDVVTQLPKANELLSKVFYKNRTGLVHLHNMALNRALFVSYVLQKLNRTEDYNEQPNILYFYISVSADMNGHPYAINGSSIIFDNNAYYPNWLTTLDVNTTIPLFGVKGWRRERVRFYRNPDLRSLRITDIGTGPYENYTADGYKMNPWYKLWLPDLDGQEDKSNKFTYSVGIKYSNETGKFTSDAFKVFNFFGPNKPKQNEKQPHKMPVRFTAPYFDCGDSNTWKISAVAPIVDFFPRYSNYTHMRRPRFVGVVVMDTDFLDIDFNACGTSDGNPGPSYLAGVDRCKQHSECKHKSGNGFKRGGYTCHCLNKHAYPADISGPYDGDMIEQATKNEYEEGFHCKQGEQYRVLPLVDQVNDVTVEFGFSDINTFRKRSIMAVNKTIYFSKKSETNYYEARFPKTYENRRLKRTTDFADRASFDQKRFKRIIKIFRQKSRVNKENCKSVPSSLLHLPGDVAYDVENQFKYQGSTALKLSQFLTLFLETVRPTEHFGYMKGGGRLHEDHLFGEVLANVMADYRIVSSGIFYEPYIFEDQFGTPRELFAPYAFKGGGFPKAIDMAGMKRKYILEDWYINTKRKWDIPLIGKLKTHNIKQKLRSDAKGTSSVRFESYPMRYYAPKYRDGDWSSPQFKCDGMIDEWVMTYSVPFFRKELLSQETVFAGIVTVDVPLENLEINQCPQPFNVANAFKNTARCHKSTKCSMIPGYKFSRGAYRCDCKQGYEYQFADGKNFIEGSLMEFEYEKKMRGIFNRFDSLVCRVQGGTSSLVPSAVILLAAMLISLSPNKFIL